MKKRNNTTNFLLLLSLLVAVLNESCDRPEPVPECCYDCSCNWPCDDNENFTYPYADTLYQSDSFKSYWYFPEGSWWVYKRMDTTADVYDTATIIERDGGIACNCKLLGDVCRERIWVEVQHSNNEISQSSKGHPFTIDSDLRINSCRASGHELFGWTYYFEKPIKEPDFKDTFNVEIGGYKHNRAVAFRFHFENDSSSFRYRRLFVKDVGLIYTFHNHHGSWELIDYHIKS
ncbi:MAG: hypothetical protein KDC92_06755 [Bacteroidetes bacterium]|nr:hypothetical protein [Bacteroidota bacterium]